MNGKAGFMNDVDKISTTKANLELAIMDHQNLLDQFSSLVQQLEELDSLPPDSKHAKFKELEDGGAFLFNGIDIRRFQHSERQALPPPEFIRRTRRRLENTQKMMGEFLKKGTFAASEKLQRDLEALLGSHIEASEPESVLAFKSKVEALRNSSSFQEYVQSRQFFLEKDPELQTEAKIIAYQEAVEDGETAEQTKLDELSDIQQSLENEAISPEEAEEKMEKVDPPQD